MGNKLTIILSVFMALSNPNRLNAFESANKIASRAVLFAMFSRQCGDYWDLDQDKASGLAMLSIKEGQDTFGTKYFNEMLVKENAITSREYHRNGSDAWCAQIGGLFKQTGFESLFRTPASKK